MNPSPWVVKYADVVPHEGRVLDLACGGGRHGRYFLKRGNPVTFVDRDCSKVVDLTDCVTVMTFDLEAGAPFPFGKAAFEAIVVTNYLHRPLFPAILGALKIGGVLIYETFAMGNEHYGRPRRPEFLLKPNELLDWVMPSCEVIAFEQGLDATDPENKKVVSRICARKLTA